MWIKLVTVALGSVLAAQAVRRYRQRSAGGGARASERQAVHRWEDDGGMVPSSAPATAPAHEEAAAGGATNRVRRVTRTRAPSWIASASG